MKINASFTFSVRREREQQTGEGAPDVDRNGCAILERRASYNTHSVGFQPNEVQA